MKISILIPCFNERGTISKIIEKVKLEINKDDEIIVIDDNSSDGTKDILKNYISDLNVKLIFMKKNLGKGAAIKRGLELASKDIIIFQDADLEYNPSDYKKLLLPFKETDADIVYGSRFIGGSKYVRIHFFWHLLANKILTFITNAFCNLNLSDMETGYKVFKREVIKSINIERNDFGLEPEVTIKLSKKNFKFFEVPISYNGRGYDEGKKIKLKDAFLALYCIFKFSIFIRKT